MTIKANAVVSTKKTLPLMRNILVILRLPRDTRTQVSGFLKHDSVLNPEIAIRNV